MKNIYVVYHSADFDGITSREVARHFLGEDAVTYIGWDRGDPIPLIPTGARLYMIDISITELMAHPGLIWIDHHRSSIEYYWNKTIAGYRIDGVAACRLAWQWFCAEVFYGNYPPSLWDLPKKRDFIERTVEEPVAVRLAGEYDIWDKRDPRVDLFQYGLRSREIEWERLITYHVSAESYINELIEAGKYINFSHEKSAAYMINELGFTLEWEGLTWLAVNAAAGNSSIFLAGLRPEHEACLSFRYARQGWRVSLRGAPARPDIDLSRIAVKHGGGGHWQACGFECKELPFALPGRKAA